MKRLFLGLLVLVAATSLAFAGDMGPRGDSKTSPIVPHDLCTWTGFYIGGSIGGAFAGDADPSVNLTGAWEVFPEPSDETFGEHLGSQGLDDAAGLVAGGFLGYNFQFGNFVLGGEAGFSFVGMRDSFVSDLEPATGSGDLMSVRQSFKTHYLITVGPRVGYAWDKVLLYATGGLAVGDNDYRQTIKEPEFGFIQEGKSDETQLGWTVGGGLEYCLSEHWRVRAEYRYVDLDSTDFSTHANNNQYTGHHESTLTYHSVTAGLAFKF